MKIENIRKLHFFAKLNKMTTINFYDVDVACQPKIE